MIGLVDTPFRRKPADHRRIQAGFDARVGNADDHRRSSTRAHHLEQSLMTLGCPGCARLPAVNWRIRTRHVATALAATTLAIAVSACEPTPASLIVDYKTTTTAKLTPDGTDAYTSGSTATGMITTAPAGNAHANLRMVGFKKASPSSLNQETCATWVEGTAGSSQPGVALRIAATPTRVRAITVTNNILFGVRWIFNIHLGDSAAKENMVIVGSKAVDWTTAPLPWRFCARAIGQQVTMKIWPVSDPAVVPNWDDPTYTATATVPAEWVYQGRPGWFVGHLAAGQRLVYTDLSTTQLPSS